MPTFEHNNPSHAGYASNNYALSPPHQFNGYGVSPPQYPYGGPGYELSNYGVPPPPQYPYQGDPGHSFSRYSVPGEDHPESGPPEPPTPTPQQGGGMNPSVPPIQTTLPSSEDVEELKLGRVDPPESLPQTPRSKRRERHSDIKFNDGNDSKRELQKVSKRNDSDRKRNDKERKGDRSIAQKHEKDDDDSCTSSFFSVKSGNPGTATSTWGFGWLSNSFPQGGTGASIAEESASTESGGSFTTSGSSSEEDSRYSFVVPESDSSASTSSDEDEDDSVFSLSGVDDSLFSSSGDE